MSDAPAAAPEILLCICTCEHYELLGNALASLAAQTLPIPDYEIMVVDYSPDHDRAEAFGNGLSIFPNLTYVIEESEGLANARNVAIRLAEAPLIAFLDEGSVASRDWAKEIVKAFETFGADCAIVAGAVDPIWGAPRPRWLHQDMLPSLSITDWDGDAPRLARPDEPVGGANIAFRLEAVRRQGGFDAALDRKGDGSVLIGDDQSALEAKIRAAGGNVVFAARARVGHLIPESRLKRSWHRRRSAWQAVSDFQSRPAWCTDELKREWPRVARYFREVPPLQRTVRGLLFDTDQADLFRDQLRAIYLTTLASLSGFAGVGGD